MAVTTQVYVYSVGDYIIASVRSRNSRLAYFKLCEKFASVPPGLAWRLFEGEKLGCYCVETNVTVRLTLSDWGKISHATYPDARYDVKPILEAVRHYKDQHRIPTMTTIQGIA